MTAEFRLSYPALLKPKFNKLSKKDEYSCVAVFPKDANLQNLKQLALEAIHKQWGTDNKTWPKNLRTPFRDQAEREYEQDGKMVMPEGYEKGAFFINLKSQINNKPGVVNQKTEDIIDETDIYAGCWCRATVNAFTYDHAANKGVSFGLRNIQKLRDGDPLGGRTKAQDDFSPVEMPDAADGGGSGDGVAKSADEMFANMM